MPEVLMIRNSFPFTPLPMWSIPKVPLSIVCTSTTHTYILTYTTIQAMYSYTSLILNSLGLVARMEADLPTYPNSKIASTTLTKKNVPTVWKNTSRASQRALLFPNARYFTRDPVILITTTLTITTNRTQGVWKSLHALKGRMKCDSCSGRWSTTAAMKGHNPNTHQPTNFTNIKIT